MTYPLSDPVPLRDTSGWPGYDDLKIIPRVYGRARVAPLRYNAAGTLYVLADHALAGVDAVTLDDAALPGWTWRNGADLTGHAVAFLHLAAKPSGALAERQTRRAVLQFVLDQVGCAWRAGRPGFAAPFPPADTEPT